MRKLGLFLVLVGLLIFPLSVSADGAIPIHGFNDLNHDGAYDLYGGAAEPDLVGLAISVYTDNAPVGSFGGEDTWYTSDQTGSSGYLVVSAVTGNYVVRSLTPPNQIETWVRSTPLNQYVSIGEAGGAITTEVGWYTVDGSKGWWF